MDGSDYVLGRFRADEREEMDLAIQRAADSVEEWAADGIDAAMNRYNTPPSDSTESDQKKSDPPAE